MSVQKLLLLVALGLTMLLPAAYSQDILISSNTFSAGFGNRSIFHQVKFDFGVPGNFLFDNLLLSNQNVGETFTISSDLQDPNFTFTINALGRTGVISAGLLSPSGVGGLTTYTDAQLFPGLNGASPGLADYQIQSFSLLIDSLSIQSPGSNPNGDGIWTDMSGQVTLMIFATPVPEPAAISVFRIGSLLAICVFYVRRRQKQIRMSHS